VTKLTPDQQDWYQNRFGERYVAVAENPLRPSRRVRRGRGTKADEQVFAFQRDALRKLTGQTTIRPL
jgi:hypothetical protein